MIRDNTDRYISIILFLIFHAGNLTYSGAQRQYRVHIKDRIHILYCRRQTLQTHAGINILLDKLCIIALTVIVKLRKHVIPDLHITVTVAAYRTPWFATAVFLPTVIIDL